MKLQITLLVLAALVIFPQRAFANEYLLQTPQIDINSDQTVFKRAPQAPSFTPKTALVETGSENSNFKKPFAFSTSHTLIDFGILSPTDPTTRAQTISISKGIANGYTLFAWEDHALQDQSTLEFIPNTTCDNGACTNKTSAPWENVLTYGFGFSIPCHLFELLESERSRSRRPEPQSRRPEKQSDEGSLYKILRSAQNDNCTDSYKRFASTSSQEEQEAIIRGLYAKETETVSILYKVNIPGTQKAGVYENTVTLLAVPNL